MAPTILHDLKKAGLVNDEVYTTYTAYETNRSSYQRSLRRCIENWRFYTALDAELGYGQWSEEALMYMSLQRRQILQYNICEPIVDRVAGGIMSLPVDPDFIPTNSKITSLTQSIKKAMYSDKELMDWPGVMLQMAKGGLVFESVTKMDISTKYHDLGNIGFEYCLPGSVTPDQMWKSWRGSDCKRCYHEQFFQPEEIIEQWPESEWLIGPYLYTVKQHGHQYGPHMGPTPFGNISDNSWGTALKVISQYEMVKQKYKQEYAMTPNGDVAIPRILKNAEEKIAWLNANVPDWAPDYIYQKPETEEKCVVTRICPAASLTGTVEKAYTEIQVGRLPFFWWSASRSNGEPKGLIDSVKDAQINVNSWQSLITNKLQTEGGGGSQFVDRAGFASDEEFDKYKAMRNNPAENFEVTPGSLAAGNVPAKPTQTSQFPREAYEQLKHIIGTMLPHISKVTPVSKGLPETDIKSGYLYKLMTIQSEQQLYTIHYGWRVFWNEVYEAYLIQASQTYSNEQIPRTFTYNKGHESVTLNEEIDLPDGRKAVKNDASQLMYIRHKVIISEKQSSPSQKIEDLKVLSEYIPSLPPEMQVSKMYLSKRSMDLVDVLDEDDKQVLDGISNEEVMAAMAMLKEKRLQSELNTIVLENKLTQAKMAIQQQQQQLLLQSQTANNTQQTQPLPGQPQADNSGEAIPVNGGPQVHRGDLV